MEYNDFIASYAPDYHYGMFTEEADNKLGKLLQEIAYVIFTEHELTREKLIPHTKRELKRFYNSDSKNLSEVFDTEVEEEIVLYLNDALKSAGHRFKLTRWNIQQ